MKTDDLIGMLAQGAGAAGPAGDGRRMAIAVALSLPVMVVAVALSIGLLPLDVWGPSRTVTKMAYGALVAMTALWLLRQAGRPGAPVARPVAVLAAIAVVVLAAGVWDMIREPAATRLAHFFGGSWSFCPPLMLALSLPMQVGAPWAAARLAPVRPGLAGAAAGLAAGGLALIAYALHCDEGAFVFIAVWYTGGVLLSGILGWLIGLRALRW